MYLNAGTKMDGKDAALNVAHYIPIKLLVTFSKTTFLIRIYLKELSTICFRHFEIHSITYVIH